MEVIFNFLNQGWVGAIIGICGLLIALYTYKRAKIGPRLVYQMSSLKIIGKNEVTPEEITIFYKGIKVPRIIKTTLIIWNSGTKTIDGQSIVNGDPLRLEFSESEEIIGASVLKNTKVVNQFQIKSNEEKRNVLNIDFEYLDANDGVSIEILHTDVMKYPEFKGTIKGMPNGAVNWGNNHNNNGKYPLIVTALNSVLNKMILDIRVLSWLMFVVGISLILFSFIVPTFFSEYASEISQSAGKGASLFSVVFFIGLIYAIVSSINIWISRRKYPKTLNVDKIDGDLYRRKIL